MGGVSDEERAEGFTGQLVELEGEGDGEEEELVGDGDEECDGEVVVVQDVDGAVHDGRYVARVAWTWTVHDEFAPTI